MDRARFEELVTQTVKSLPDEFLNRLDNIDVIVEDQATVTQLRKSRLKANQILLGLYEGVPRTKRGSGYGLVLPDKITIFQKQIEALCRTEEEIVAEIGRVVKHEIAHHFGISDARLHELGRY
ncbi:MAG: metallopeptidase family protein [Chloroflexi bacterium]|nr:metallopeptidase family protein [Chloroflexota bacterium]